MVLGGRAWLKESGHCAFEKGILSLTPLLPSLAAVK